MQTAFHTSHKKIFHFWYGGDLSKTRSILKHSSLQSKLFSGFEYTLESAHLLNQMLKQNAFTHIIKLYAKQILCLHEHIGS